MPNNPQDHFAVESSIAAAGRNRRAHVESPVDTVGGTDVEGLAAHTPRPHPPVEEPEDEPNEHAPETEPESDPDSDSDSDQRKRPPRPGKAAR